jgi:hypothetical protein
LKFLRVNLVKSKAKLDKYWSLMDNYELDWRNLKPRTKLEKTREYKGLNWPSQWISWRNEKFVGQLRVKIHKFRTKDQK